MRIKLSNVLVLTSFVAILACGACSPSVEDVPPGSDAAPTDEASTDGGAPDAKADVVTCSDTEGDPGKCTGLTCSSLAKCEAYKLFFKPALGQKAVACLTALTASCAPADILKCGKDALETACPDDTADSFCDTFMPKCAGKPGTKADCVRYARGLNGGGRGQLAMCDCAGGVVACVEAL